MKKDHRMVMPHSYAPIDAAEMENISGGAVTVGSLFGFISYLLSGLSISFGTNRNRVNTDTTGSVSQATVSTGGPANVSATATHATVQTDTTGTYFNWGADFNLGGIFNALLRLIF